MSLRRLDKNPHKEPARQCVVDECCDLTGGLMRLAARDGHESKCRKGEQGCVRVRVVQ